MQFGTLAGNSSINFRIYECLPKLHEEDVLKFVRKFRTQPPAQALHTYRELLLGSYLADLLFKARYDRQLLGRTPDWSLLDEADELVGLIELATFHQTFSVDSAIASSFGRGETWVGWMPSNTDRLYQKLQEKSERYEHLANTPAVPYIVSIFGEFTASIDAEEIEEVLLSLHGGAFTNFKSLSGLLYFEESGGRYKFRYFSNRHAPLQFPLRDAFI